MTGTDVTAFRAEALDFLAQRAAVDDDLALLWSVQAGFRPGFTRLLAFGTHLALFDANHGIYEVVGAPAERLSTWPLHRLRVVDSAPGYRSEPVLMDADGVLYRWTPGQSPRVVGNASAQGIGTAVVGLPDDEVFLQGGPADQRQLRLFDSRSGLVRWSLGRGSAMVLPHDGSVFLEPSDQLSTVECLDRRTGAVRWRSPVAGGIGTFVGVVETALWIGTRSASLVGLDIASGKAAGQVRLRTRYPAGVLDETGRLHVCDGFGYDIVELRNGGRVEATTFFTRSDASPSLAMGRSAIVTTDNRLIFADERGAVFVVGQNAPGRPQCLFAGGERFAGMGSVQGQVVVLDQSGALRAFGRPIERHRE